MKKKILIALPAFNEGANISRVLASLANYSLDVLVVDDGSTDNTKNLVSNYDIQVVQHSQNLGLSAVYKTFIQYGIKHRYTHIITLDSDGQHDAKLISVFVDSIDKSQIIIGNRFSELDLIPVEKISSNFFASLLTQSVYHIFLPDISCGFRAFSLDYLNSIPIHASSYGVIYQMVFESLKRNIRPHYIPMRANYDNQYLRTNSDEIISLLEQIQRFNHQQNYEGVIQKVISGKSFIIELSGKRFNFEPIDQKAYVISTEIMKIRSYYI